MSSFLIDRIFHMCYTDKKQRRFLKNMDNQKHSNFKRVIACLMAVLMIFTAAPLSAFAADEHTHEYEAQGKVTVTRIGDKYVVGDETYKCALCSETKKEKVYLTDDFNKFADAAKEITGSGKYNDNCAEFVAVKSAYEALIGLTAGTHYASFISRRVTAVYDAVEAFIDEYKKNADEMTRSFTVKFVYYTEDHQEKAVVRERVVYGDSAIAPATTELSSTFYWDGGKHYEFNGKWDKDFSKITSDLVVTAQYKPGVEHDFKDYADKVEPTCSMEGSEKVEKCRTCGFKKGGEPIAKKEHNWGEWVENAFLPLFATKKTKTCKDCLEKYTLCIKEDHNFKDVAAKDATCLEDGWKAYKQCKNCDYNTKEVVKAVGHHTVVVDPAKAPTCSTEGLTEGTHCSVCNCTIEKQEEIAKISHDFSKEIMTDDYLKVPATCTEPAVYCKSCSMCGIGSPDDKDTFTGKELGHNFIKKNVGIAPKANKGATCTEPAKYYYSCSKCSEISDETFTGQAALGHDWGDWKNNADGKTMTRTCKRGCTETTCINGKDGKPQHNFEVINAKAATCTTDGNSKYRVCKNCGLKEGYVLYPAGHKYGAKETAVTELPTCLSGGNKEEVSYCIREGCKAVDEKTNIPVPALGHKYGNFTDDQNAKTHTKVCQNSGCTASVEGNTVTEAHNLQKVEEVKATCLVDGTEAGEKCELCSYNTAKVIKAPGKHTEEEIPEVPATCGKTGLSAGKKCSVCGEILVPQEETPMKTEHTPVEIPAVAATCTENGSTAGKKCSVCGKVLEEPTVIEALGHDYEVVTPAKEATCTEDGCTESKKCKICGDEVKAEVIPNKGGHKEVAIPDIAGDCTTDKSVGGKKCSVCGAIIEDPEITQAPGHVYEVFIPAKKATLSENGATESMKCAVCGDEVPGEVIAKIDSVALTVSKVNYNGKACTPGVIVKDADGKTLTKGVDFTVGYKNNINPGKALVTVSFIGDYDGTVARNFVINYSYTARTAKLAVNQTTNSIKASWSAVSGAAGYRVQLYKGKTLVRTFNTTKTSVTIKKLDNGKKLSAGTEYKVVITAFSKIGGKVYYSTASRSLLTATKTVAPVVKSVSAGKKSVTLKWNKVAGATGYTVYYSTKKNSGFKSVKATTKTYRTVKNLKSGKTYYVKVVANKRVAGNRIASSFSKTYKVTVK